MKFVTYLKGKKSYGLAAALFVYATLGFILHKLTLTDAVGLVWGSATVAALRAAISTQTPPTP